MQNLNLKNPKVLETRFFSLLLLKSLLSGTGTYAVPLPETARALARVSKLAEMEKKLKLMPFKAGTTPFSKRQKNAAILPKKVWAATKPLCCSASNFAINALLDNGLTFVTRKLFNRYNIKRFGFLNSFANAKISFSKLFKKLRVEIDKLCRTRKSFWWPGKPLKLTSHLFLTTNVGLLALYYNA
ncbi:hypothetical protein GGTG_05155 [Gaeumannomyces tritici R3-111a-1]|uniref:Uncharacterized protein n=1 Tax=Gaeumannomyces tritici (strain R3-111a-1) TaxID=644352 RepID=J3NV43_GAET3|nr:hypothetical protein GGTG_05155 [Gaeumannomyces tritici R3-111a-1]EJT75218.1 hypothetical protein GGTG_05155 [Gaeumannomyces tritici R3-111a-1]